MKKLLTCIAMGFATTNYAVTTLWLFVVLFSFVCYFFNQTATWILELTNHAMVNYIGNYDYFLEN